jgi:hypothetical protein
MLSGRVGSAVAVNRSCFSREKSAHNMIVIPFLHCFGYLQCFKCAVQAAVSALMMTFFHVGGSAVENQFFSGGGKDFAGGRR